MSHPPFISVLYLNITVTKILSFFRNNIKTRRLVRISLLERPHVCLAVIFTSKLKSLLMQGYCYLFPSSHHSQSFCQSASLILHHAYLCWYCLIRSDWQIPTRRHCEIPKRLNIFILSNLILTQSGYLLSKASGMNHVCPCLSKSANHWVLSFWPPCHSSWFVFK